jgi:hypothetical protein
VRLEWKKAILEGDTLWCTHPMLWNSRSETASLLARLNRSPREGRSRVSIVLRMMSARVRVVTVTGVEEGAGKLVDEAEGALVGLVEESSTSATPGVVPDSRTSSVV